MNFFLLFSETYPSVAEQNSVDIAWELLNRHEFKLLRECIYSTQEELSRFRQLVVNSVMATDIVDKELGALRKKRWETAFSTNSTVSTPDSERDDVNRKATIVIEHLIQVRLVSLLQVRYLMTSSVPLVPTQTLVLFRSLFSSGV